MNFKEIGRRLTGISLPFGGISWQPPSESETTVVRRVIAYLENRRVLFDPFNVESPDWSIESILQLRSFLTEEIGKLDPKSHLAETLRAMRAACFKFLQQIASGGRRYQEPGAVPEWLFYQSLGELRGSFGIYIAELAVRHKLDIKEPLIQILPADPNAGEKPLAKQKERPPST